MKKRSSGAAAKRRYDAKPARRTDAEIRVGIAQDPDAAPEADREWFRRAEVVEPEPKEAVYIRLDRSVLRFFRETGPKYQTRINAVLRAYVQGRRSSESEAK